MSWGWIWDVVEVLMLLWIVLRQAVLKTGLDVIIKKVERLSKR